MKQRKSKIIQKIVKFKIIFQTQNHTQQSQSKPQNNQPSTQKIYPIQTKQSHKMQYQNNFLQMQDDDNNFHIKNQHMQSSFIGKSNSKFTCSFENKNQSKELQDLLESDTVIYGNTSSYGTQKKRLITDLSFFSKDCTQDLSNQQGYHEMVNKIHFERSRNRQLHHQLTQQKQRLVQKYLDDLMNEFKELSEENKRLRGIYKKQAGGGYKQKLQRNNSVKQQVLQKNIQTSSQYQTGSQTPSNNIKNGRKSIAALSVTGSEQPTHNNYNSYKPNMGKDKVFFGLGNQNFCETKKMQTLRPSNKLNICQSSINIVNGQSLAPSPKKHKRRQSQLTQRKDYPNKQNYNNDFLLIMDDGEMSFDNEVTGRMSQPGKMPKQRYAKQVDENQGNNNWVNANYNNKRILNQSIQKNSLKLSMNNESDVIPAASNAKNIFLQFLETLLIEERISYTQMTDDINQTIHQQQQTALIPSYTNIKHIEQLEKQIMTKNLKLRQLQQVINVFKSEIEQIMGTDIKMINELMIQLLEVKGKYLEMQEKVNGITGLKRELEVKEKMKENIITQIKEKIEKKQKQVQHGQQTVIELQKDLQLFPIPQSIKTLFDLLNIKMPKSSKPIQYLTHIKDLPKNKDLFQAFDSKKRSACNMKIKEIIDQIREGRKKFNEVIKIYQGRIVKIQQKIHKYKTEKQNHSHQSQYQSINEK